MSIAELMLIKTKCPCCRPLRDYAISLEESLARANRGSEHDQRIKSLWGKVKSLKATLARANQMVTEGVFELTWVKAENVELRRTTEFHRRQREIVVEQLRGYQKRIDKLQQQIVDVERCLADANEYIEEVKGNE